MDIAQTKLDLANARQKLATSKRAIPYKVQDEIAAFQEVQSLEEGLEYALDVLKERF